MITETVKISFVRQTVPHIVNAVQGDSGRVVIFEPDDFVIPEGATATYYVEKTDGEAVYNTATIDGNKITVPFTAQALAASGDNNGQVRIELNGEYVTSFAFLLRVLPFYGIDAIESDTEMNIFDKAVEEATEQIRDSAEEVAQEVIDSIPADYTALTNEVSDLKADLTNTVTGNPLFINDAYGFAKVESAEASKCIVLDRSKAIITNQKNTRVNNGVTFCNDRRGVLTIIGKFESSSQINYFYSNGSFTGVASNATPIIRGDGNGKKIYMFLSTSSETSRKMQIRVDVYNITDNVGISSPHLFNVYTGNQTQPYFQVFENSTFNFEEGKEYGIYLYVNPASPQTEADRIIGTVRIVIMVADDVPYADVEIGSNAALYDNSILMCDEPNTVTVSYLKNENEKKQYAILKTFGAERKAACNILVDYNSKEIILFDLSDEYANDALLAIVKGYKIKAIILSHMHHDHVGMKATGYEYTDSTFYKALKEYMTDDAVCYVQQYPPDIHESWRSMWTSATSMLTEAGISWMPVPYEGYRIDIGNFKLTFRNVDISAYTDDLGGYNNTSLCTYAEYFDNSLFVTGDIRQAAEANIAKAGIKPANVLVAPHHGIGTKYDVTFMRSVRPNLIIFNVGTSSSTTDNPSAMARSYSSAISVYAQGHDIDVFDTYENKSFDILLMRNGLVFHDTLDSFTINGITIVYSNIRDAINDYVPDETDESEYAANMTLRTLLRRMRKNTEVHCFLYGGYGLIKDIFGEAYSQAHSGDWFIFSAKKYTGANSNNAFNRGAAVDLSSNDVDTRFNYEIDVCEISDSMKSAKIVGNYYPGGATEDDKWATQYPALPII